MELKCCICGTEFIGYGNNAEPIRKGVCCDKCNMRYVFVCRNIITKRNTSYEIIKTVKEKEKLKKKLEEKNFELEKAAQKFEVYHNPENDENVVICIL